MNLALKKQQSTKQPTNRPTLNKLIPIQNMYSFYKGKPSSLGFTYANTRHWIWLTLKGADFLVGGLHKWVMNNHGTASFKI